MLIHSIYDCSYAITCFPITTVHTDLEREYLLHYLFTFTTSVWKYLIWIGNCLCYQARDMFRILWQEIALARFHGTYVALNDMLHLPRPSLKESLRSLYMLRLNLGFPYGKTQSSPRPWRAKRTRITWSRTFLGPQFCWPAPSSHADSYFLFFCFHWVSIEQIASKFIDVLKHGDLLDEICFWRFLLPLFQTLLPIRVDWSVNSMKLKSWPKATSYLSWSLTR